MSPKVGTVEKEQIRDSVWAAASRTLSAFAAEELFDLPIMDSVYPGATIAASAVANTFGSWVELSANIGSGKRLIGVIVFTTTIAPGVYWEVEFGEGAAAAEAAIARIEGSSYRASHAGYMPMVYYPLWKALSTNARLSARVRNSEAVANGFQVSVLVA